MSKTVDIFISNHDLIIEKIVQELELFLCHQLEPKFDDRESWYEFQNQTIAFSLGKHDFENDRGLNFADYPYQISIVKPNKTNICYVGFCATRSLDWKGE